MLSPFSPLVFFAFLIFGGANFLSKFLEICFEENRIFACIERRLLKQSPQQYRQFCEVVNDPAAILTKSKRRYEKKKS